MIHLRYWLISEMQEQISHILEVIVRQTSIIGERHQDATPNHSDQVLCTFLCDRLLEAHIGIMG